MTQKPKHLTLIGDVKDRDVIIVDDEVDTGGCVAQAVNVVKQECARGRVSGFLYMPSFPTMARSVCIPAD